MGTTPRCLVALYPSLQPTVAFEAGGISRKVELHHDAISQCIHDADGLPINITVGGAITALHMAGQEFQRLTLVEVNGLSIIH